LYHSAVFDEVINRNSKKIEAEEQTLSYLFLFFFAKKKSQNPFILNVGLFSSLFRSLASSVFDMRYRTETETASCSSKYERKKKEKKPEDLLFCLSSYFLALYRRSHHINIFLNYFLQYSSQGYNVWFSPSILRVDLFLISISIINGIFLYISFIKFFSNFYSNTKIYRLISREMFFII